MTLCVYLPLGSPHNDHFFHKKFEEEKIDMFLVENKWKYEKNKKQVQ